MTDLLKLPAETLIELGRKLSDGGFTSEMVDILNQHPERISLLARVCEEVIADPPMYAMVIYEQPDMQELRRRFKHCVLQDFAGAQFQPIERCRHVPQEDGELAFRYVVETKNKIIADADDILMRMEERFIRPALYEELLSFLRKYPEEQRKFPIVGLGSTTVVRGKPHVAFAAYDNDRMEEGDFIALDYRRGWPSHAHFLGVEKSWKHR